MADWPLTPQLPTSTTGLISDGWFQPVIGTAASGDITLTLPTSSTNSLLVGVKTVANTASAGTPARLNAITLQCSGTDTFNTAGGSSSLDLSGVGQAVLLQLDPGAHVWYVVSANLDRGLAAAGTGPVVTQGQAITAGQTVNTGAFFQSSTGQDPSLTQLFNGFLEAGSTVVSGVANTYSDIGTLSMALSGGATVTLPTNALL